MCRVLNAESSSCVEFVSAAAFSVSCCVRVETMAYDVNTFKNGKLYIQFFIVVEDKHASNLRNAFNMIILS